MSVNRALEVVTKWLERVATRDPALFKTFVAKVKLPENEAPVKKVVKKSDTDTAETKTEEK